MFFKRRASTLNGLIVAPKSHIKPPEMSITNPDDINKSADEDTKSVYEPGRATEMLTQSVLDLNFEHDRKEEFKVQAGKILSGMLESRLIDNITQSHPLTDVNNDDQIIDTNVSSVIEELNSLSSNNNNLTIAQNDNNNLNGIAPLNKLEIAERTGIDLPAPPTLAELSEHINDPINQKFETNHDENDNTNDTRNTNDKTESTDYANTHSTIDGFSAKLSPVQPQFQQHHCQTQHLHQNNTNGQSNSVVFRNKNTKPELTTHARDRRSYIEKDNFKQNRFPNHNNNSITSHTTDIVSNLRDGRHPICTVCHTTITR